MLVTVMRQNTPIIKLANSVPSPAQQRPANLPGVGPQPAQSPLVHSSSRLDFIRAAVAEIIAQWHAATPSERPGMLMRLRIAQDQIATLRHTHPRMTATPSRHAWVDDWTPEE